MKRRISTIILIALIISLTACGRSPESKPNTVDKGESLVVYTTVYPVYDFANKIGGDRIDLRLMVPPGAEPHDWEPSAKLMAELEKADVLVYNGAGMETWIDRIIGTLDTTNIVIVEATKDIDLLKLEEDHEEEAEDEHDDEDEHGEYDPHVWLDPIRAIEMGGNIKAALVEADSSNRDFYENNYNEFKDKLIELDNRYKEELLDKSINTIVVSHASFGYLADRYGLEQISVSGITPQEEPSPAKMARISELVREHDIRFIFFETLSSPRMAQVLSKETGTETEVLNPIGGLTQEDVDSGKEYFNVMESNLEVLKKALK